MHQGNLSDHVRVGRPDRPVRIRPGRYGQRHLHHDGRLQEFRRRPGDDLLWRNAGDAGAYDFPDGLFRRQRLQHDGRLCTVECLGHRLQPRPVSVLPVLCVHQECERHHRHPRPAGEPGCGKEGHPGPVLCLPGPLLPGPRPDHGMEETDRHPVQVGGSQARSGCPREPGCADRDGRDPGRTAFQQSSREGGRSV